MREIDIKKNRTASLVDRRITIMPYGPSGSGKTRFAATFPRPLFLSEKTESGWTTIEAMDDSEFFEPGVLPRVWEIESAADMIASLEAIRSGLEKKPGSIQTVVIDSFTFYSNLYLGIVQREAHNNPKLQGFAVYGKLGEHLNYLMTLMHSLPVNVVWLCLAQEPSEGSTTGSVMLTGKTAQTAPARCDYFMYLRKFREGSDSPDQFSLHPHGYGIWPGRCRDGGILPDVITDVSYRGLMAAVAEGQKKKRARAQEAAAEAAKKSEPAS